MNKFEFEEEFKPFNLKKEISKTIDGLQGFDPIKEAEEFAKKTGIKDDKAVDGLGLHNHMIKCHEMREMMDFTDDTKFSETSEEYIRKITDFGFEKVYEEDFSYKDEGDNGPFIKKEKYFIFFHYDYSILLDFDTYDGNRNGGNLYYNWSPNEMFDKSRSTSSGMYLDGQFTKNFVSVEIPKRIGPEPRWKTGMEWKEFDEISELWWEIYTNWFKKENLRTVWRGNHDCREAVKHNINKMLENGVFLKKWKYNPILSLCHHHDWKDERATDYSGDYTNNLTEKRIEKLPKRVQNKIGEYH